MAKSKLLAMDPGENTGWAYFEDADLVAQGTIPNAADGVVEALRPRLLPRYDRLVLEAFIVQPDFVGRAHASEVIGVMILDAHDNQAPHSFQLRSQKAVVKRGSETERFRWLREMGYSGSSHELDAITHGLLRLRLEKNLDVIEKHWPQH